MMQRPNKTLQATAAVLLGSPVDGRPTRQLRVSMERKLTTESHRSPANKTPQATAAALLASAVAMRHNAVVAGAGAPPAAVPELGR
jgi:hypothetical protein